MRAFPGWANTLRTAAALLAPSLLALSGCASIEVGLGLRTRLNDVPVTALSASLSFAQALGPGQSARLVIVATTAGGKQLVTVGPGHGDVLFDSFTFDTHIVQVNEKGVVTMPADPRLSDGQTPHLRIKVVGHPDVTADLDVPLRYDVSYTADFSGKAGSNGFDGFDGQSGSRGSDGSIDLSNPSAGGRGGDGTNGSDGDDGAPGSPGEAVHVWLRLQPGPRPLLQARVAGADRERLFLVDPHGGMLAVQADGGSGGRGGRGGRGGEGGNGGSGFPSGFSGNNGRNGFDGHQGSDGAAGTITVSVDPAAQPFLDRLRLSNNSGSGTPGSAPQIQVEAVPPLW